MKFLPLVWAGLKRKKLRTTLTFLSILIAFLLFAFLGAIKEAFNAGVTMAGKDRLITRHKVSLIQTLPESYTQRIKTMPGVSAVCHQTWFGGIYQDPKKSFFASMPVVPDDFLDMFPEITLKEEEKKAWKEKRTGAIIGRMLADKLQMKVGDRIPLQSPIWGVPVGMTQWEFDIAGIFDNTKAGSDTNSIFFRYDYFEEARQRTKGQVGWYTIRVADAEQATQVALAIDQNFENSPYETKTEPEGAFAQGFAKQIGDIGAIVMAVVGAVFFTILLVAGNTMAQSVRERTGEIGVLKAMGFTNTRVLVLVLLESCFIAVLGGFSGLALAALLTAGPSPAPDIFPIFKVPPDHMALGAGLALALGIVAGVMPSLQAMRLRISEALRLRG